MNELFEAYLEDFKDTLLLLNDALMRMQKGERGKDVLNAVFRVAHTIKGNSAGVEFFRIEKVMHTMEDILQEIRDGKRVLSDAIVKLLFDCYDFLEDSVQVIERTRKDDDVANEDILEKIVHIAHEGNAQKVHEPKKDVPVEATISAPTTMDGVEYEARLRYFTLNKVQPELLEVMIQNAQASAALYRILVELSDASVMRNVRMYMIYDCIDRHAQCMYAYPERMTEEDLRNPEYEFEEDTLEIFVLGNNDLSALKKELLDISDIMFVEVELITQNRLQEERSLLIKENMWIQLLKHTISAIEKWEGSTPTPAHCADAAQSIEMIAQDAGRDISEVVTTRLNLVGALIRNIGARIAQFRREHSGQLSMLLHDLCTLIYEHVEQPQSSLCVQIDHCIDGLQKAFATVDAVASATPAVHEQETKPKAEPMKESSIIRVPIQKVDELMDMLGELLILNSQMEQKVTQLENMDSGLNNVLSRSAKLIRSIQGLSMSLRMVEIKPTLHRLTRIARDTAKDLKKRITIEIEGEDTEIDRSASEKLFDPLMHLVRNAVSHGIESEEDRVRFGKSKEGVLTMCVYSKRGNVYIEIEDDGQGINVERVLAKARKQGLAQDNKEYTEEEIIKFIFHPGFSTQEVINNISGRGVGMNVVEAEIHKMGGKVEIINNPGRGAKFVVRIPMNLAVLNGTVAEIEGGRYIFPTLFIKQFYIPQKTDWVVMQGKNKAIRVRDSIIPVITARDLFHSQSTQQFTEDQQVIILEMEQKLIAFPVDRILSRQEIVSKPLGSEFSHVGFATGAAILGDGNVSVILDIEAMFSLTLRGA